MAKARKKVTEKVSVKPLRDWFDARDAESDRRAKFSKQAGYSSATVTNWLTRGEIPRGEVYKVASHMGITEARYRSLAGAPVIANSAAETTALSDEALQIAIAWQRLPPARQQAFHDWIFLEAVVANHYPWLMRGRPTGESYVAYEKAMVQSMLEITDRMLMKEKGGG